MFKYKYLKYKNKYLIRGGGNENNNSFEIIIYKLDGTSFNFRYNKSVEIYTIKKNLSEILKIPINTINLITSDSIECIDTESITSDANLSVVLKSTLFDALNNNIENNNYTLIEMPDIVTNKRCKLIFNFDTSIKLLVESICIENVKNIEILTTYRFIKEAISSTITRTNFIICESYTSFLYIHHNTNDLQKHYKDLITIFDIYPGDKLSITNELITISLQQLIQLRLSERNTLNNIVSKLFNFRTETIRESSAPTIDCKQVTTTFNKLEILLKKIIQS
jgi:hypothetical protein